MIITKHISYESRKCNTITRVQKRFTHKKKPTRKEIPFPVVIYTQMQRRIALSVFSEDSYHLANLKDAKRTSSSRGFGSVSSVSTTAE